MELRIAIRSMVIDVSERLFNQLDAIRSHQHSAWLLTNSSSPKSLGAGLTLSSGLDPGGNTRYGSASARLCSLGLAASAKPLKAATNSSHATARLSRRIIAKECVPGGAGEA